MNRGVLPFSVDKATPVAVTANAAAAAPSSNKTAAAPPPPSTPAVAAPVGLDDAENGEVEKPAAPSEKLWAALRTLGAWKATVLGAGSPVFFTASSNSVTNAPHPLLQDGSVGRQSSAARLVEMEEEKEDHVFLPIIPELGADGQSKNLKGETIVGAVCDIRHSPNRILRVSGPHKLR
ncbi:hypothetical protein HPB48_004136 [Haemaphysalis longicornis]|uniref:Uncharacterized protein n=1 Tax=Haemaphysalis longicornis TaxID=44386 RepID=A0A9J6FLC9_HAELO|nr:hypothetical protein HPB48_004136 [Haemaphysalis longicornis]